MNIQKFTQKSLEAIQNAQNLAIENQNTQVDQEHILLALINQEDSLIKELLKKMEVSQNFEKELENKISNKPKMTAKSSSNINAIIKVCLHGLPIAFLPIPVPINATNPPIHNNGKKTPAIKNKIVSACHCILSRKSTTIRDRTVMPKMNNTHFRSFFREV